MHTQRRILLLLASLALAGSPAMAGQGAGCVRVTVSGELADVVFADGFESGDQARWQEPIQGPLFSAVVVDDLTLTVELDPGLAGDHVVEIRSYLPGDRLYQSRSVPVTVGGSPLQGGGSARRVEGYPFPLPVTQVAAGGGLVEVSAALPVGGTSIVATSLYGIWRVEARLDGAETTCTAPAYFTLWP